MTATRVRQFIAVAGEAGWLALRQRIVGCVSSLPCRAPSSAKHGNFGAVPVPCTEIPSSRLLLPRSPSSFSLLSPRGLDFDRVKYGAGSEKRDDVVCACVCFCVFVYLIPYGVVLPVVDKTLCVVNIPGTHF